MTSFPLTDLISGQAIRYVQNDHKNKEPKTDVFIFHVSDGINNSPTYRFSIDIQEVNDESPVALFEPLMVVPNNLAYLSNSTFHIVDFDTPNEEIEIYVEELPKSGILYLNDIPITKSDIRFYYLDIINQYVSYKMTSDSNIGDEIKFRITDGKFTVISKYYMLKSLSKGLKKIGNDAILLENNKGLQAIAGMYTFVLFFMLT